MSLVYGKTLSLSLSDNVGGWKPLLDIFVYISPSSSLSLCRIPLELEFLRPLSETFSPPKRDCVLFFPFFRFCFWFFKIILPIIIIYHFDLRPWFVLILFWNTYFVLFILFVFSFFVFVWCILVYMRVQWIVRIFLPRCRFRLISAITWRVTCRNRRFRVIDQRIEILTRTCLNGSATWRTCARDACACSGTLYRTYRCARSTLLCAHTYAYIYIY